MGAIKNILVGTGKVEINPTSGTAFDSTQFTDVGFTVNGVEMNLQPNMVDVQVDQLGDAAKVIHNTTQLTIKTTLAEATLNNLAVAWGYANSSSNNLGLTSFITGDGVTTDQVLNLGAFAVGQALERSLRFTGTNQNGFKRIYVCTRVISMTASAHSYQRGAATVFPVEFRVLPDASRTGSEYGTITDEYSASA